MALHSGYLAAYTWSIQARNARHITSMLLLFRGAVKVP